MATIPLKWTEAAEVVLEEEAVHNQRFHGLTNQQLFEGICQRGLVQLVGNTPINSMNARINKDIKDNAFTPFVKPAQGVFALKKYHDVFEADGTRRPVPLQSSPPQFHGALGSTNNLPFLLRFPRKSTPAWTPQPPVAMPSTRELLRSAGEHRHPCDTSALAQKRTTPTMTAVTSDGMIFGVRRPTRRNSTSSHLSSSTASYRSSDDEDLDLPMLGGNRDWSSSRAASARAPPADYYSFGTPLNHLPDSSDLITDLSNSIAHAFSGTTNASLQRTAQPFPLKQYRTADGHGPITTRSDCVSLPLTAPLSPVETPFPPPPYIMSSPVVSPTTPFAPPTVQSLLSTPRTSIKLTLHTSANNNQSGAHSYMLDDIDVGHYRNTQPAPTLDSQWHFSVTPVPTVGYNAATPPRSPTYAGAPPTSSSALGLDVLAMASRFIENNVA